MRKIKTVGAVFAEAARVIAAGKEGYICIAIERMYEEGEIGTTLSLSCIGIIEDRLEGFATYLTWLGTKHPKLTNGLSDSLVYERAQIARVAWCKSLAKEFKGVRP